MTSFKKWDFTIDTGHWLVLRLHSFYSYTNRFSVLLPLNLLFFFLVSPFIYFSFILLNKNLGKIATAIFVINVENYATLKRQLEKLNKHVKYFHTFFNADKKMLSWFMRPLFPLIKEHIHLQAEYRNLLQEKIAALTTGSSGTRFIFLKETELWEYRNKAYSYLS